MIGETQTGFIIGRS